VRALRRLPPLGPGQRHGLLAKQLVERGQPLGMNPREQVLARARHPGQHRLHQMSQLRAGPILPLRSLGSLCSLRHGGSLAPALGTLSWSTRFSRRPGSRRYSVLKFNRDRDIPVCGIVRTNTSAPHVRTGGTTANAITGVRVRITAITVDLLLALWLVANGLTWRSSLFFLSRIHDWCLAVDGCRSTLARAALPSIFTSKQRAWPAEHGALLRYRWLTARNNRLGLQVLANA